MIKQPKTAPHTENEWQRMRLLMAQFRDTPCDLADASLVVESLSLRRIITLDSHFYAYRTADGRASEVAP